MHASLVLSIDGGRVKDGCGMPMRRLPVSPKPGLRLVHVALKRYRFVQRTQYIKSLIAQTELNLGKAKICQYPFVRILRRQFGYHPTSPYKLCPRPTESTESLNPQSHRIPTFAASNLATLHLDPSRRFGWGKMIKVRQLPP
jgi:hypothetical protein